MTVETRKIVTKLLEKEIKRKKAEIVEIVRDYTRPENKWRGISQLTLESSIECLERLEKARQEILECEITESDGNVNEAD